MLSLKRGKNLGCEESSSYLRQPWKKNLAADIHLKAQESIWKEKDDLG